MEGFLDTSGLFAVAGHRDAASLALLGLHGLQHRGTAGAAVAVSDGTLVRCERRRGPVAGAFDAAALEPLQGALAIGQVYGRAELDAPLGEALDRERLAFARHRGGPVAAAVCGRFTNGARLRRELLEHGALFHGGSDAELLLHLVAASTQRTFVNRVVDALWRVQGAYALLVLSEDHLVAVRDPAGYRPLVLGRLGEAQLIASEDDALRLVGADPRREVQPGEMLVVDHRGVGSVTPFPPKEPRACAHEHLSLARRDATVFGRATHAVREALGRRLGAAHPCPDADVVCAVLGGDAAARGYAAATGLTLEEGVLTEAPILRALPEPPSGVPHLGSALRWRAVPSVVEGRSVVLVAPTLSTGRSVRRIARLVLDAGARAVHLRVASPPIRGSCPFGIASPMPEELVALQTDPRGGSAPLAPPGIDPRGGSAPQGSAPLAPPGIDPRGGSASLAPPGIDPRGGSAPGSDAVPHGSRKPVTGSEPESLRIAGAGKPEASGKPEALAPPRADAAEILGVQSVGWLGLDVLHEVAGEPDRVVLCDACFTHGRPLDGEADDQLPLF